jgi:hypothetical protein
MLQALARDTLSEDSGEVSTEEETVTHADNDSLPSISSTTQGSTHGSNSDDDHASLINTQSEYDQEWIRKLCSTVNAHIVNTATYDVFSKWSAITTLLDTYHTNTLHLTKELEEDHDMLTMLRNENEALKSTLKQVEQVYLSAAAAYQLIN